MPLHWLGLLTQSHLLPETQRMAVASAGASIRTLVTLATICTVAAQILFVWNFFASLVRARAPEANNPWRATTLEWSVPSPAPRLNFGGVPPEVHRGAYDFTASVPDDFVPQQAATGLLVQKES
jgi:cytochrome c oxidase subunit 1